MLGIPTIIALDDIAVFNVKATGLLIKLGICFYQVKFAGKAAAEIVQVRLEGKLADVKSHTTGPAVYVFYHQVIMDYSFVFLVDVYPSHKRSLL